LIQRDTAICNSHSYYLGETSRNLNGYTNRVKGW